MDHAKVIVAWNHHTSQDKEGTSVKLFVIYIVEFLCTNLARCPLEALSVQVLLRIGTPFVGFESRKQTWVWIWSRFQLVESASLLLLFTVKWDLDVLQKLNGVAVPSLLSDCIVTGEFRRNESAESLVCTINCQGEAFGFVGISDNSG